METLPDQYATTIEQIVGATRLGDTILDVACRNARAAIALALAGRRVLTFATSAEAGAQIAAQPPEVRSRIVVSGRPYLPEHVTARFHLAYADDLISGVDDPAAFFVQLRERCVDGAPIVLRCPNGPLYTPPDALWTFNATTLDVALRAFGEPAIAASRDRTILSAMLKPSSAVGTGPIRVVALLRLTTQDRWVNESLNGIADLVDAIVTLDDNVPRRTFAVVRDHLKVIHAQSRPPLPPEPEVVLRAERLARAWQPDWVLRLDSSEILSAGTAARIVTTLRSVRSDVDAITLKTEMLWDRSEQRRANVPAGYERRIRLTRGSPAEPPRCIDSDASIRDYAWAEQSLRTARKALAIIDEAPGGVRWQLAEAARLEPLLDARPIDPRETLLERALQRVGGSVSRILCIDPGDLDVARIAAAHWPAAITAISQDRDLRDPHKRPFDLVIRGALCALDLDLFFGGRVFDAVIDCGALRDGDRLARRFARLRSLLDPGGRFIGLLDESTSTVSRDDVLASRVLYRAGFQIDAIDTSADGFTHLSAVGARVRRTTQPIAYALTVVVPIGGGLGDAVLTAAHARLSSAAAATPDVRIIAARGWDDNADARALPFDPNDVVAVIEPGIDAAVAAAFEAAPARVLCVFDPHSVVADGWCAQLLAAFEDPSIGIVALESDHTFFNGDVVDGPVLAVRTLAVPPMGWPTGFADDRLRAGVLAGIAARKRFGATVIPPRLDACAVRASAAGSRRNHEAARAAVLGVPGESAGLTPGACSSPDRFT